ncbi:MAG: hypothetical protein J6X55_16560 [Victivallales bacterium]|nr:hypothetical protein [Victivallales bacterium]
MNPKLFLLSITTILLLYGCSEETNSTRSDINLSYKARAALQYIENELPPDQRDVLLRGSSDSNAEANAIANLMASGHLDGYAEYIEAMQKQK